MSEMQKFEAEIPDTRPGKQCARAKAKQQTHVVNCWTDVRFTCQLLQ